MKCLVVGCHPDAQSFTLSVSARIAARLRDVVDAREGREGVDVVREGVDVVREGVDVVRHVDLYREEFDPILDLTELRRHWSFDPVVQRHIGYLRDSNVVVIVHPLWWGGMPALLAGWLQRVWKHEVAFRYEGDEFTSKTARGLLQGKRALVICLADSPLADPGLRAIETQWKYTFSFCAMEESAFVPLANVREMTARQRAAAVTRVCQRAQELAERVE